MIEYTPEDYEFALRILHHREDLTEEEVSRWMDEPEHLESVSYTHLDVYKRQVYWLGYLVFLRKKNRN